MSQQQLQTIVQMMKALPRDPSATIEQMRAGMEQFVNLFPVPPDVAREPVQARSVKAEWVTVPGADEGRAILYLHGGGYVMGSIDTHRALASRISKAASARVLLIDYGLAPEHPHPAAVDDAVAAYRWLLAHAIKPARIAIAGDSAGGGLCVATLVAARDANLPLPAAGVCLSPWVDLEGIGESMKTNASADPMIERDGLLRIARAYLGGKDPRTPLAAPLYADLSGLPPLLIQVGTAEVLLDDSARLAERAQKFGVKVTYQPWENMFHVFQAFAPILDEGQQAIDKIGEFVKKTAG